MGKVLCMDKAGNQNFSVKQVNMVWGSVCKRKRGQVINYITFGWYIRINAIINIMFI